MNTVDLGAIAKVFSLTPVEHGIIEYLVGFGDAKAVEIRKIIKSDRASFYRAINNLVFKNLIVVTGAKRSQVVRLQELSVITNLLHEQRNMLGMAEKSLTDLTSHLREIRDSRFREQNIEIISGENAYLKAMQSLLKGGGKILRDITPDSAKLYQMAGGQKIYEDIVKDIRAERLSKNIAIRILFDREAKNIDALSATNTRDLKESRRFSGNLHLNCYLNTCGNRTLFYTQDATGSWGIIIKDELITKLLNSLFDVLWEQATPL